MTEERLKEIEEVEMSGQIHRGVPFPETLSNAVCDIIKECHVEIRRCWGAKANTDAFINGIAVDIKKYFALDMAATIKKYFALDTKKEAT